MAAPVNHWKLGSFVLLVVGAAIVAVIAVGECSTHHATLAFWTYFDESVGGLESGGRVEFRGVDVGSLSAISIAPDHRHVAVKYDLDVDSLAQMGILMIKQARGVQVGVPADLRAQVGGNGLTGVKYMAIDIFNPQENPPPALPFAVPENYIPAATSTLKSLEDSLMKAANAAPALVDAVVQASGHLERMLAQLERNRISDKAAATFEHADRTMRSLEDVVRRFDRERVPQKASVALDDLRIAVEKVDHVLDRLDGERGLIASIGRATDGVAQVGRGVSSSTRDLDQVLDELREAAEAIRVLAQDLDRDPDMLFKGRASGSSR